MTATDQAFIRIFDTDPEFVQAAPHVSFAARGVQLNETFEPATTFDGKRDLEGRPKNPGVAECPQNSEATVRPEATGAPRIRAEESPSVEHGHLPTTYLPSAYRNFAPANDSEEGRQPQPSLSSRRADASCDTRRRPISDVVREEPPLRDFRPALEVDAIRWPRMVTQMLKQCGGELGGLGSALETAGRRGMQVILFRSMDRKIGCTTMVLASARLLAERGRSLAVVDAEFLRPSLAATVGLSLEKGWEASLLSGAPLAESVVRSLKDGISIVPLAAPIVRQQVADAISIDQVASVLRLLAGHFELVLVDAGALEGPPDVVKPLQDLFATTADACVLVTGDEATAVNRATTSEVNLQLPIVGVVENGAG